MAPEENASRETSYWFKPVVLGKGNLQLHLARPFHFSVTFLFQLHGGSGIKAASKAHLVT